MGSFLTPDQLRRLQAAETLDSIAPIPTRMISNGEFMPLPQTAQQRQVEARIDALATALGARLGLTRRSFLKTACGMAASFVAMNEVYGGLFHVDRAEASDVDAAADRAARLAKQFVFDAQLHFVRDDCEVGSNPHNMLGIRGFAAGFLNSELRKNTPKIEDIKFQNFVKEVYFDSDTHVGILSGAPSDELANWFLTNDQMALARDVVNEAAGSKRLLAHSVLTPGQPGWVEEVERCIAEVKPDSWKGYTMGDPNGPSKYRWRLDDEELLYPVYEKIAASGIRNICLHKGLLPPDAETRMPGVTRYADVSDVGKAARDWPQLNFIIYHCGYNVLMPSQTQKATFEETGEIPWVSDLARIPEEYGVDNVFAEIGSSFGISAVMNPRFCAGMMGTLIAGMGADKVFWGTDAVWYGSPQWQIEALRRLEIPEDLREKFGYAPLGSADDPVKSGILGLNSARHYGIDVAATQAAFADDRLAKKRAEYLAAGPERSNLAYGFVTRQI